MWCIGIPDAVLVFWQLIDRLIVANIKKINYKVPNFVCFDEHFEDFYHLLIDNLF
jgi:predicted GNAT superfamily acetyltransferase